MDAADGLVVIGVAVVFAFLLFLSAIAGALVGGIVGWVLSQTLLGNWLIEGFAVFGFDVAGRLVHVGAVIGFIGAFFKATLRESDS